MGRTVLIGMASVRTGLAILPTLGIIARRDTFADVIMRENAVGTCTLADDHVGPLSDNAMVFLRREVLRQCGFDPGADHLFAAVAALGEAARFNPVTDWLDGLQWDRTKRLKEWLPGIAGADPTELNKMAGVLLILGMVARSRYPGTKFDQCFVLEGSQGCGKSTLARMLSAGPGNSYFADAPGLVGMETKERAELLRGKWVIELAELSGLAKSETEGVKAFLSQSFDRYRPAYARVAVDRPRHCIFVPTTNARAYLSDGYNTRYSSCAIAALASLVGPNLHRSYATRMAFEDPSVNPGAI